MKMAVEQEIIKIIKSFEEKFGIGIRYSLDPPLRKRINNEITTVSIGEIVDDICYFFHSQKGFITLWSKDTHLHHYVDFDNAYYCVINPFFDLTNWNIMINELKTLKIQILFDTDSFELLEVPNQK